MEVTSIDDAALVLRVLDGNDHAAGLLYRRYAKLISVLAMRMVGSRSEAEDILQDTFIDAFDKLHTLRSPGAFRAWLCRIAVSKSRAFLRRQRFWLQPGESNLVDMASSDANAEDVVALEELDSALVELSADERIMWTLRVVEGYRLSEIVETCSVSLATVKRKVAKADKKIRERFRGDFDALIGAEA